MIIEQPAKWLRWIYPKAIWRMDSSVRAVYLTFDDGPIPESTPFLLKTLREFDAKATFFMVGENVDRYPELFQQIIDEGHQVGNHTYNHLGAFKHWAATYLVNTHKANMLLNTHLFRPPHGWMRRSIYTAEDVLNNVKRYARNGSIITFHDSLKSIDKLRFALPEALKWLKEQGYEFKTFD